MQISRKHLGSSRAVRRFRRADILQFIEDHFVDPTIPHHFRLMIKLDDYKLMGFRSILVADPHIGRFYRYENGSLNACREVEELHGSDAVVDWSRIRELRPTLPMRLQNHYRTRPHMLGQDDHNT